MNHAQASLERMRAQFEARRAEMERTVADLRANAEALAMRMPPAREPAPASDEDYDTQDTWLQATYGSPAESQAGGAGSPFAGAVGRIERGELSWGDVFSGRATDPESRALREFVDARLADYQRARKP